MQLDGWGRVQMLRIPAPGDWLVENGGRGHPKARNRLVQAWKDATIVWARFHKIKPVEAYPVRIIARVTLATKPSRWDPTNWAPSAKAAVDGLVKAGVLTDDNWRMVYGPDMRRAGEGADKAQLTLVIREGYEE